MKRTADTLWSWPGKVRMFLYSSEGSQSLMVRSLEQLASNVPPLGPPKSTSSTALVWPLTVLSSSPSSQSHILMVVSSEPDARDVKTGWKATHVTGFWCDWSVCRAGALGSQLVGSWFRLERDVGVALSTSDWRAADRDSSSIICDRPQISTRDEPLVACGCWHGPTFFCRRTTLVHFFSRRPSYFLTVLGSRASSDRPSSCRNAAAVLGRLFAERYAMMDLCLPAPVSPCSGSSWNRRDGGGGLAAPLPGGSSISGSWCRGCLSSRPGWPLRTSKGAVVVRHSIGGAVVVGMSEGRGGTTEALPRLASPASKQTSKGSPSLVGANRGSGRAARRARVRDGRSGESAGRSSGGQISGPGSRTVQSRLRNRKWSSEWRCFYYKRSPDQTRLLRSR